GPVHERGDQADLLAVPLGQRPDGPVQLGAEPGGEPVPVGRVGEAADAGEAAEDLPSGGRGGQDQLAGEVTGAPVDGDGLGAAVVAEDPGGSPGGAVQAHQDADGGALT